MGWLWLPYGCLVYAALSTLVALTRLQAHRLPEVRLRYHLASLAAAVGLLVLFGGLFGKWWGGIVLAALGTFPPLLGFRGTKSHALLVWWKKRLRRREGSVSTLWQGVSDTYWWQRTGVSAELEAADVPAGRGVEPEAAPSPQGCEVPATGGWPTGDKAQE